MKKLILILALPFLCLSCDNTGDNPAPNLEMFDQFDGSKRGWTANFADYPVERDSDWKLEEGIANLPEPLDTKRKAYRISGINHSDDLFMYFTKQLSGLKPNTQYVVSFTLEFATDAPSHGWAGVGGAPNISLGVGAVGVEPKRIIDDRNYYRLNIGKMNQVNDGTDMKVIGDTGNGTDKKGYALVKRSGDFTGRTDADGNLWLIFGTDSGFEAATTLYYTYVDVKLAEQSSEK